MQKRSITLLLGLVAVKIILQYVLVHPVYELHRDEFLHLDQGDHLAWGFVSVPPLTSWTSLLIRWLGNGEFWVRLFPALYGALTLVVVWKTIGILGGQLFARLVGVIAVMFSAIFRLNMLYQPNSFDILAWTFVYFAAIRLIQTNESKWMYATTLALAFGFLNKYSIAFLATGLILAVLLTPHRQFLTTRRIVLPIVAAVLVILPNIIWQLRNDLPVIYHMEALARTQLHRLTAIGFLKEQLLFFVGSLYVVVAGLIALAYWEPFRPYRFALFSFLITLVLFTLFKAKGYYAVGLYPVVLAFGAVYLDACTKQGWRRHLRPVIMLLPIIIFIPLIKLIFPIHTPEQIQQYRDDLERIGVLTWEDGSTNALPQDYADMLGWREMASLADHAIAQAGDADHTLVMCDNYGQAGAVNHYSNHRGIAYTMNADYIHWIPNDRNTRHIVLVQEPSQKELPEIIQEDAFENIMFVGEVTNPFAREKGANVWLLQNARIDIDSVIQVIRAHELSLFK